MPLLLELLQLLLLLPRLKKTQAEPRAAIEVAHAAAAAASVPSSFQITSMWELFKFFSFTHYPKLTGLAKGLWRLLV